MSLQHFFRLMLVGVIALLLAATLSPPGRVGAAASNAHVHYIYADDGLCPDSIDGYQITGGKLVPTPGMPYSAGKTSRTQLMVFGYNTLAVTPANSVHGPCLVHSDGSQAQVESFTIDPATGVLTLASTVSALSKDPSSLAKDVRISSNGNLVYVSITPGGGPTGNLSSLSLGTGCMLKLDQQFPVPTQSYDSLLLVSASRMVAINLSRHGIDTYALTPTGGITFVNSVSGRLSGTDGVADQTFTTKAGKQVTILYTGQFRLSIKPGSNAQAGQYTPSTGAFSSLASSPQKDLGGISLDYLLFNTANHYLIGTESFSGSLGVWSAANFTFKFFGHVRLPSGVSEPTTMAQIGTQLFVIGGNSVIVRCTITAVAPGVTNCAIAANLSGNGGGVEGVAIF